VEPVDPAPWRNRKPRSPQRAVKVRAALTPIFGFLQLDFPGTLALADGRYVVREDGAEQVLVLKTLAAPAPPRRRRRARAADREAEPTPLPLARAAVVRASTSFADENEARAWLERTSASDESVEAEIESALALLNRALHAHAVAAAEPAPQLLSAGRATVARLGFGNGEEVAEGTFTEAREVDPRAGGSRRRHRAEQLRPQERVAAVLGGRERLDSCETLVLRARADLDADRNREAALQLRVGLDALLAELRDAVADPSHDEDIATLESRHDEATKAADTALRGDLDPAQLTSVEELTAICERVLRRRRVLRG
jgi:hypothetical protein